MIEISGKVRILFDGRMFTISLEQDAECEMTAFHCGGRMWNILIVFYNKVNSRMDE